MTPPASSRYIVVGAGIHGLSTAMHLARELLGVQLVEIGNAFGGRDHSTVIHAYNLIQQRVTNDSGFRMSIEKIERELKVNQRAA